MARSDYRVCKLQDSPDLWLVRCYYDSAGEPTAYAEYLSLHGTSREALRDIVAQLQEALTLPVLEGPWYPKWHLASRTTPVHETKPSE